jgi:hypothetical protein
MEHSGRPGWEVDLVRGPFALFNKSLNVLVQQDMYGLWWVFVLDADGNAIGGRAFHNTGYDHAESAMAWGEAWAKKLGRPGP